MKKCGLIIIFILIYSSVSFAEQTVSTINIRELTENFIKKHTILQSDEKIEIKIADVNELATKSCAQPVEVSFPANASQDHISTIVLSCAASKSWEMFVPVQVNIQTQVLVAKQTIAKSEQITAESLSYAYQDKNQLYNGYFKNINELIGKEAKHVITAGTVLTKANLKDTNIVFRNQPIDLIAKNHAISVTMRGIAKSDGAIHENIKVYNPSSKKILDAVVIAVNKAEVIS